MKERWSYGKYKDIEKTGVYVYYKEKQTLTWQFFLRVIHKWFNPCDNCQKTFDALWNIGYCLDGEWYERFIGRAVNTMCKKCLSKVSEVNETTELILGNKDYEPPLELSRKWLITDDTMETISKKEYFEHMRA